MRTAQDKIVERLKVQAAECGLAVKPESGFLLTGRMDVSYVGDPSRLLMKLIVLENGRVQLSAHESQLLSADVIGQFVSLEWIASQMSEVCEQAKDLIKRRNREMLSQRLKYAREGKSCPECFGEGKWAVGNRSDGDAGYKICPICHGVGRIHTPQ